MFHRLLGDTGYSEYSATLGQNDSAQAVELLAARPYVTDTPLTAMPGDRLVEIVGSRAVAPTRNGMFVMPGDTDRQAVMDDARDVLSPDQSAVLRAIAEASRLNKLGCARMLALQAAPVPGRWVPTETAFLLRGDCHAGWPCRRLPGSAASRWSV